MDSGDSSRIVTQLMFKLKSLVYWAFHQHSLKLYGSSVLLLYDADYLREQRWWYNTKYQTTPSLQDLYKLSWTGRPDNQKVRYFAIDFEDAILSHGESDREYQTFVASIRRLVGTILMQHRGDVLASDLLKFRKVGSSKNVWFTK